MAFFRKIASLYVSITFSALCLSQADYPKDLFSPPLNIPLFLSGNFAEIRSNHFHSGIDIKTQGAIRKKLYAPSDGYVSRVYTSTAGYGKAIFLTHPSGYRTVYAHLDEFPPAVKKYVEKYQYKNERHTFDLFPLPEMFPVKKGEFIGFTGNSGGSSGPHLHFEIRKVRNEHPLNALLFMDIKDNIKPVFYTLCLYPLDTTSLIENKYEKALYKTPGSDGKYKIAGKDTLSINGEFGIGIEAYDYLDGSRFTCGIYSVRVLVDSVSVYYHEMNDFSFYETRYINSFIDYEERIKTRKRIQKTFIDPNNPLSIYQEVINRGKIRFNDSLLHKINIIIKDINSNQSELSFFVRSPQIPLSKIKALPVNYAKFMKYEEENKFTKHDIILSLPQNALYKDLRFSYAKTAPVKGSYSSVYHIHNKFTPIHKWSKLSIKLDSIPEKYKSKALLAFVDNKNKLSYAGGEWKDDFVTCRIRTFGKYAVTVDTIPPTITPYNISKGKNMSKIKAIRFKVNDNFSGIKSYNGYIDSQWVLFEYDKKNNLLYYTFDAKRLKRGKTHELELYIVDQKNNLKSFQINFFW